MNLKKFAPYIWIIAGFILISCFYCMPQFQGKRLDSHDGYSWEAASHEAVAYHDSTGIAPLWSNSMFGGMPTYTVYLSGIKDYVQPLQVTISKALPDTIFLFFLPMLGFFILACSLRINKWVGAVGAVAYAFATYNPVIISAGHITKMISIGHMPGILAGFLMIFNGRRLSGAAVMGLFLTLMISYSHYQMVYYMMIILLIAGIGIAIDEIKNGRMANLLIGTGIVIAVGLVSAGPSLPNVLTTNEYAKYTMRGGQSELKKDNGEEKKNGGLDKEYAFRWSNGIGETFCYLVPQLYGGAIGQDAGTGSHFYETLTSIGAPESQAAQMAEYAPLYWGPQAKEHIFSGPVYFGAIICFLFVLGLMLVRNRYKWWILALVILSTFMSWGSNFPAFNYFLFDHVPMANKFRAPSMVLTITQLMFPLMAVLALNDIFSGKVTNEEIWKKTKTAAIITAGLCLLLGVGGQMFFDFRSVTDGEMAQQYSKMANNPEIGQRIVKALQEDRAAMAMKSGIWSAVLIVGAAGAIWAFAKGKFKKEYAIGALALLVMIDLIPTAKIYLGEKNYADVSDYESRFTPRPVDEQIMKDKDPYYRVLDLSVNTYNDAMQAYFHKCVGGYSPSKMETYQDLIDVHLGGNGFNSEVLNMLNTKYVIFNGGPNNQAVFQPNMGACGNAWFVDNVHYVNNANEEMDAMKAPKLGDTTPVAGAWSARNTAIVRSNFQNTVGGTSFVKDSAAFVRLSKYGLNDIHFESSNAHEGLAVFSDIYYDKGWKAYIDGKETPIVKANYVLRALKIPAGTHKIDFEFKPETYYKSNNLAMISSILLYVLFGAALFMAYKHKEEIMHPENKA